MLGRCTFGGTRQNRSASTLLALILAAVPALQITMQVPNWVRFRLVKLKRRGEKGATHIALWSRATAETKRRPAGNPPPQSAQARCRFP